MAEITISNVDWEIFSSLKTALAGASLSGQPLFKETFICLDDREIDEKFLTGEVPRAIVLYTTTSEGDGVDDEADCIVEAEIVVVDKVSSSSDSSQRIQRGLELKNGAVNAINGFNIFQATGVGGPDMYHPGITWGKARLAVKSKQGPPWVICRISFKVSYSLASDISH